MTIHRFDRQRRLRADDPRPIAHLGGPRRAAMSWPARVSGLLILLLLGWLGVRIAVELVAPRPLPVVVTRGGKVGELDCSDFRTRIQVERFMHKYGSSTRAHRLDGDGDGKACEALPWLTFW